MREVLWRAIAVALAGIVCWLAWPSTPKGPSVVQFTLEPPCEVIVLKHEDGELECWENGAHKIIDQRPLKVCRDAINAARAKDRTYRRTITLEFNGSTIDCEAN